MQFDVQNTFVTYFIFILLTLTYAHLSLWDPLRVWTTAVEISAIRTG